MATKTKLKSGFRTEAVLDVTRLDNLLKTPDFFDDWVRAHNRDADIGLRCNSASCPLSVFIKEMLDFYAVMVSDIEVKVWVDGPTSNKACSFTFQLPLWAQYFIEDIDGMNTLRHGVSFSDAVDALDDIRKRLAYNNA